MRTVRPPRLVEVSADSTRNPGFPEAWRRDGWPSSVRYSVAVGIQHVDWMDAGQVKPALVARSRARC